MKASDEIDLEDEIEQEPEKFYVSRDEFLKTLSKDNNNPIDDIRWVFHALGAEGLKPEDAPSSGAWNMLQTLQDDDLALKSFYTTVYPKLLPTRAQMEKGDSRAEDGRKQFDLIDRILREPISTAAILSDSEKLERKLAMAKKGIGSRV